ncbi:hypothetical protein LX36DRAFT_242563 [Colletotrichum falcatum]|nr:hypothetical protein LX36DRAFT_242563 [Colletotrichum falcatum]
MKIEMKIGIKIGRALVGILLAAQSTPMVATSMSQLLRSCSLNIMTPPCSRQRYFQTQLTICSTSARIIEIHGLIGTTIQDRFHTI